MIVKDHKKADKQFFFEVCKPQQILPLSGNHRISIIQTLSKPRGKEEKIMKLFKKEEEEEKEKNMIKLHEKKEKKTSRKKT